jgi:ABC-2 type transport system permease protein
VIRLTGVELRRLTARRITMIGVAGVVLITAFLLFVTWREARPLSELQQQQAKAQFELAHKDWVEHHVQNEAECRKTYDQTPDPKPSIDEMCSFPEPKASEWGKPQAVFAELIPTLLQGASYFLLFAAFLIGASFVAAEFSSGAIGNWLTFEPRRLRVYGSKLVAAGLWFVPRSSAPPPGRTGATSSARSPESRPRPRWAPSSVRSSAWSCGTPRPRSVS